MSSKSIRVATDVGGTFTDMVAFETDHDTGIVRVVTAKADTTPPDFETGVLNVLAKGKIDPAKVDFLVHGTTVVINALTERKGVKVGLITTEGFRDTLEIARRLGQKETDLSLFVLNSKAMTLRGPSGTVQLTPGEANLLEAFANAPENRLGIKEAEGQDHPTETTSKGSFVVQVGRLRKKLVAAGAIGEPINAIRGYGYQLSIPVTKS